VGGWRRLHNQELHNFFTLRKYYWGGQVTDIGMGWTGSTYVYNILIGKSEETSPLRRIRRRWEDNIKVDLRERVWKL